MWTQVILAIYFYEQDEMIYAGVFGGIVAIKILFLMIGYDGSL